MNLNPFKTTGLGKKQWVIPGGNVPVKSNGHEPDFTSHDKLSILNTGSGKAAVKLTIYFADKDPYGPYELEVESKRVKKLRFNDLIDPQAMPLDTDYGCVIESNVPIVVQFSRLDTNQAENAILSTMAYPIG